MIWRNIAFTLMLIVFMVLQGCATNRTVSKPGSIAYVPLSLKGTDVRTLMRVDYPAPPRRLFKSGVRSLTTEELAGGLYSIDGQQLPRTGGIVYMKPGEHKFEYGRLHITRETNEGVSYQESKIKRVYKTISGEAGIVYSWAALYDALPVESKRPVVKLIKQ